MTGNPHRTFLRRDYFRIADNPGTSSRQLHNSFHTSDSIGVFSLETVMDLC
jgi:hypothetical protein